MTTIIPKGIGRTKLPMNAQDMGKVAPAGFVRGNREVPRDEHGETPETTAAPLYSTREGVEEFMALMEEQNWILRPRVGGDVAGFDVYTAQSPDSKLCLNTPQGFKYITRVERDDPRYNGFVKAAISLCNTKRITTDDEGVRAVWTQILKCVADRPKDGRSAVAMVAMGLGQYEPLRNLVGDKRASEKFVPPLGWFPESLQTLDTDTLLDPLLPRAEANVLKLCLGRVLMGRDGQRTTSGKVPETRFASFPVLIGFDGGEGKSALMSTYIGGTLKLMGYTIGRIDPESNRFSNSWVANSDLGYGDELDDRAHERLLTNWALIKSVISGESKVIIEEKGVQGWEVTPTSLPFFNSNNFDNTWLLKSNGGMRRRYNALQCLTPEELKRRHGSDWKKYRLLESWRSLAKQLGVTTEAITARFLRACLDYYQEVNGIRIEDGHILWTHEDSHLEETMNDLRKQLRIDVSMEHGRHLLDSLEVVTLAAAKTVEERYRVKLYEKLEELPLLPKALHTVVELWRHEEEMPERLKGLILADICPTVRQTWDAQADILHQDLMTMRNPAKAWERIVECMLVKGKGWHFQKGLSSYSARWDAKTKTFREHYDSITSEDMSAIPELSYAYLRELGEALLQATNIVKKGKVMR